MNPDTAPSKRRIIHYDDGTWDIPDDVQVGEVLPLFEVDESNSILSDDLSKKPRQYARITHIAAGEVLWDHLWAREVESG